MQKVYAYVCVCMHVYDLWLPYMSGNKPILIFSKEFTFHINRFKKIGFKKCSVNDEVDEDNTGHRARHTRPGLYVCK